MYNYPVMLINMKDTEFYTKGMMVMEEQKIRWKLSTTRKKKPEANQLAFGRVFTDHMFTMDYTPESGWHHPQIVHYQPLTIDPSAMVFHYGQSVFEGMKAYLTTDGE